MKMKTQTIIVTTIVAMVIVSLSICPALARKYDTKNVGVNRWIDTHYLQKYQQENQHTANPGDPDKPSLNNPDDSFEKLKQLHIHTLAILKKLAQEAPEDPNELESYFYGEISMLTYLDKHIPENDPNKPVEEPEKPNEPNAIERIILDEGTAFITGKDPNEFGA